MENLFILKGQVDEARKEIKFMAGQLKEKDNEIFIIKSYIVSLKIEASKETRMKEEMENHLSKKDDECKKMKEEIDILRREVDQLNKSLKRYQTLDDILIHQRSPLDKSCLGYVGEPSRKNDANPNASNNKDVENLGRNVDAPSSNKRKEINQDSLIRNPTPRSCAKGVKDARCNGYHQRITRKNTSEVHQDKLHPPST